MISVLSDVERFSGLWKCVGSVFILSGTGIGAGMMAMPLMSVQIGFSGMVLLLLINLIGIVLAALLMLEASLAFEPGSCIYTLASRTLGAVGKTLAIVSPLFLFYALMVAYISGGGSLLYQYFGNSLGQTFGRQACVIFFTLFAGSFVYWSTHSVDVVNRWLFIIMLLALIAAILSLSPQIQPANLLSEATGFSSCIVALPVIFTSFGFHGSIPSIILYLKEDLNHRKLIQIFILSGVLPFVVYCFWLMAAMGVLSNDSLLMLEASGKTVGGLIIELSAVAQDRYLISFMHIFADLALVTSFFGVSLGLFDYLAKLLCREDSWIGRLQTAAITFVPPVVFALFYPEGFVTALGYASIALAVLAILLPVCIVRKIRKQKENESHYQAPGGKAGLVICFLYGSAIIAAQCIASLGII